MKRKPRLVLADESFGDYVSGSGTEVLIFKPTAAHQAQVKRLDMSEGMIFASRVSAGARLADFTLPARSNPKP